MAFLLFPPPRSLTRIPEPCDLRHGLVLGSGCELLGQVMRERLGKRVALVPPGQPLPHPSAAKLLVDLDPALAKEAYRLTIAGQTIRLAGSSEVGIYWAACTLCQWLQSGPVAGLGEGVVIEDQPDFADRGVMLDVSRNRVPSMATLYNLIDLFSSLKINQLQLYVEHTFAYPDHPTVWQEVSPLTADEIGALVAYCQARFIELVPNQNSFGHFHRWLQHPSYRHLAECPQGIEHPFSRELEPFSLCATDPAVPTFLGGLYDVLLPLFPSTRFNGGLDETFDLGLGRSAEACAQQGKSQVYLNFLNQVHGLAQERGKQLMFWGDIILTSPELLGRLPEDVIALEWGYDEGHPFEEHAALFAASGRAFYVCPGTSSWHSFAGRWDNCLANLSQAAAAGFKSGALGYLITDWGDKGHLQPLCVSYPGFLAGATFAWNSQTKIDDDSLGKALEMYVFGGASGLGELLLELGRLHRLAGSTTPNGTSLFFLWWFLEKDLTFERVKGIRPEGLSQVVTESSRLSATLDEVVAETSEAKAVVAELKWACAMMGWSAQLGLQRLTAGPTQPIEALDPTIRHRLADELAELNRARAPLWARRHRSGGWSLSKGLLDRQETYIRNGS